MANPGSSPAYTAVQQNLKWASAKHGATFTQGKLALPPSKKYLVLTCMDARIDPAQAFGINLGDAHVIRNAGACAKDALRSIVISEQLLGTQEIILVKHTGCGMLTFRNEDAYKIIEGNLGPGALSELQQMRMDFLPFPDLEEAVYDDIKYLESTRLIPSDISLSGWIYEVETGKTRKIC